MRDEIDLGPVAAKLAEATGITFGGQRRRLLRSRVDECWRASGIADVHAYVTRLMEESRDGKLWRALVDAVVTDETSWFRYGNQFAILKDFVLPALASNKSFSGDRELRILSAGCSRGQEPYSIAMTLREVSEVKKLNTSILGVDLSDANIDYARAAHYSDVEMRGMHPEEIPNSFRKSAHGWRLKDEIRSQVDFRQHNLLDPFAAESFDIVFCRNVVIYFDQATTRRVMASLARALRPGGYLFIGHAESGYGVADELRMMQVGSAMVYRHSVRHGATPASAGSSK